MSTAEALGIPSATLSGKLEIHLTPCTRASPPREAGRAMIRDDGRSGKRRKYDGGFKESPSACKRYVASTTSTTCFSRPSRTSLTWRPEMTANGATGPAAEELV